MSGTQVPQEQNEISTPTPQTIPSPQSDNITFNGRTLINIAAAVLFISFFLPWTTMFGHQMSGLDIQKNFESYKLVWALPLFAAITLIANLARQDMRVICRLTGAIPFGILFYALNQEGKDVWQILSYGAWLALGSGAALVFIGDQKKHQ